MAVQKYQAHLALLGAAVMWGVMAPVGKAAMESGISSFSLALFRMVGAAVCFWLASLAAPQEKVSRRELLMLSFAGVLGVSFNQGCFTFGLSLTSPIDASIMTTTLPIVTMIVAAIFLKEPITGKKVFGVLLGTAGALLLILGSIGNQDVRDGNIWGNLLCLTSQVSFAFYLAIFKDLIARYHIFTLMKWMFTFAALSFLPFSIGDVMTIPFDEITTDTWLCVSYVVFCGTFLAYILMMTGQKVLRPTVLSMYNYVQPIASAILSIVLGMGIFDVTKGIAVVLVFVGVYVVTQSKSREQMLKEKHRRKQ